MTERRTFQRVTGYTTLPEPYSNIVINTAEGQISLKLTLDQARSLRNVMAEECKILRLLHRHRRAAYAERWTL